MAVLVLDVTHGEIRYDKTDRTFSAELSDIDSPELDMLCRAGSPITVLNPKTGNRILMKRFKVDTDGEDVYGYWYMGTTRTGSSFKFLFIND
jgi:hypothetical protein